MSNLSLTYQKSRKSLTYVTSGIVHNPGGQYQPWRECREEEEPPTHAPVCDPGIAGNRPRGFGRKLKNVEIYIHQRVRTELQKRGYFWREAQPQKCKNEKRRVGGVWLRGTGLDKSYWMC